MSSPHHSSARRHFTFGWWSLFVFASLGMILEMLHGFKIGWYLDVSNETRRLMFTLSHAHGTLLALIHIGLGATLRSSVMEVKPLWKKLVSPAFIAASFLLPGGFFLGGLGAQQGDPGIGIFLVPVGGLSLLVAIFLTACQGSPDKD